MPDLIPRKEAARYAGAAAGRAYGEAGWCELGDPDPAFSDRAMNERLFDFALRGAGNGGGYNAEVLYRQAAAFQDVPIDPNGWPEAVDERRRRAFQVFSGFVRGIARDVAPDEAPPPPPSEATGDRAPRQDKMRPRGGMGERIGGKRSRMRRG